MASPRSSLMEAKDVAVWQPDIRRRSNVFIKAKRRLDPNAMHAADRKIFMMKGFHHPNGSQAEFINGLAILHNLVPYQRRAKNAGQCGIEVEGGKLPSENWFLNLQILVSGGFQ